MDGKTVCFSGHRPEKLPCRDENSPQTNRLKSLLYKEIYDCIQDGYVNFVTGLAKGIDNWAADMVIEFMSKNDKLRLICVMPYADYGKNRKGFDKWELSHIIEKASEVIVASPDYSKHCMRLRNEKMVDLSDRLVAVVIDYKSGTGQTIRYAQKKGIETRIIDISADKMFFTEKNDVII